MTKTMINTPLSVALRALRRHLDWQQEDLAKRIMTSRRSVVRWERGQCEPIPSDRAFMLQRLSDVPYEVLAPLARALDLPLAPPAPPAPRRDDTKRVLDEHLRIVAENADMSARRLREAVVSVLGKATELRLTVEEAGAMLAPAPPRPQ